MLVVLAGLPGVGKTTLGDALAGALHCPLLSVDRAEAAMWEGGIGSDEPTHHAAYLVVAALAADQLSRGSDVVVDAVNGPDQARAHWRRLSAAFDVPLRSIVVICSDESVHRRRLARRHRDLGYPEASWESVLERQRVYLAWTDDHLVVDTVNLLPANMEDVLSYLRSEGTTAHDDGGQLGQDPLDAGD